MSIKSPTGKQLHILWFALTGLAIATILALIAGIVWGLGVVVDLLSPVLWPLGVAAVVACLLSPVVDFFERQKISRASATTIVFILAFTVVVGVLASVVPQVVVETKQLAAKVPQYATQLQTRVNNFISHPPDFLRHFLPATDTNPENPKPGQPNNSPMAPAAQWVHDSLPTLGKWLFGRLLSVLSAFSLLAGLALVPVYAFYFLLEQRGIDKHWREYLPVRDSRTKEEAIFVIESINQYLITFFRGQVLVAICDAILYTIGLLMVGVNYAFLLGFMAVFLQMIPFIGAIILFVIAITLGFAQYTDWQHPMLIFAVFVVVQTLETFVISPKIMGDRVGLHPLVIIIAVMAGTTLMGGVLGGVLAIPLAAALRVILFRYVWKKPA